jgi:hypothetical integral membrane protein (TIGR02206 family)
MQNGFQLFGPTHLAVIALVPVLAGFLAVTRRRFPRTARPIRYTLALLLLACTVAYYGSFVLHRESLFPAHVPLELCDMALWLVIASLVSLKPALFDVTYYWALVGTLLAVVTPNLTNPSVFLEVQFFADHGLIVVAVLYLIWSGQLRPRSGSAIRSLAALNALALLVGTFDFLFKTNYMFLRDKPDGKTLMNLLGPWPWYIAACECIGLAVFPLLYLPFWRKNAALRARELEARNRDLGLPAAP